MSGKKLVLGRGLSALIPQAPAGGSASAPLSTSGSETLVPLSLCLLYTSPSPRD